MIRPMLWQELEPVHDVRGWLASEKLDGFRAVWDGHQLYSRFGNVFPAPAWFTERLPNAVLDGELYAGLGGLQRVKSAVQTGDFTGLDFRPFDAPLHFGDFLRRLDYVNRVCDGSAAVPVPHEVIADYEHAREMARQIKHGGGEGIVLRNPRAPYQAGSRVWHTLKFKP